VLPQGAPTSPCLSNIFFKQADDLISSYCNIRKIRYTRYADDLTFSGDFDEKDLQKRVTKIITPFNLKLNEEKSKLMTPNMRQTVTGIVVNTKSQVVFHKRNDIRKSLYYINKFGLENHIKHEEIKQANYLEHLLGKVNFVLQINPHDNEFKEYKDQLIKLKQAK
jgi:RNA-directed DNA polymerase